MLAKFEFKGYFWIPERKDERLPGLLKFDPKTGTELELWGRFDSYKNPSSLDDNILLGVTSDGKRVTMLNCMEHSRGMSFPGFPVSGFSAIYLFVGDHITTASSLYFKKATLKYTDINHWLDISGFQKPKYDDNKKEVQVIYTQPSAISIPVDAIWQIEIDFNFYRPIDFFIPLDKASIEQKPLISLTPKSPQSFKTFHDTSATLSSLLAICYFEFPVIEFIKYYVDNPKKGKYESEFIEIELFYATGERQINYKPHHSKHSFLIHYREVNLVDIIPKWFSLYQNINATIDILTENLMKRGSIPTEFTFLGYVQALENMHRQLNSNSVSLKSRLDEIVTQLPSNIKFALLENELDFTNRIKNHRNYFTHYNPQSSYIKASLNELFILSEKMKIALITYILKTLEIDDHSIERIIIGKGIYLFNHVIKVDDVKKWID